MNDWQPCASLQQLRRRAELVDRIRQFFSSREVLEVSTPLIAPAGITDPNIDSVALTGDLGYLRTSPEYFHKRLLAAGFGDLYELGPVFRAGEHGRMHRNEFTLLEWYRLGWSWQELATEVVDLIQICLAPDGLTEVRYLAWRDSFPDLDPLTVSDADLRKRTPTLQADCDRDMRLDYLFATEIQSAFPANALSVIHGYPASQAALARLDPADPRLAERFEVFAGPVELANGYRELTSATEQRERFEQDNCRRESLGRAPMPLDEWFLAALDHGLPECAGVALGLERLVMVATGASDIAQVRAF